MLFGRIKIHASERKSSSQVIVINKIFLLLIVSNFREQARDMFYHAYYAYMDNAYPADELMPLSCKGRYRGLSPNRGDIDDCLGK